MLQVYGSYRQAFDLLTTFLLSLTHYACICMRVCRFPTLMQVGAPTHILLPPTFCSHPHSAPSIPSASVYDSYRQAFDMLTAFPEIKTLEDNVKFTQMLTMVRAAVLIMGQPIAGTPHSIVDMLTAFPEIKTLEDNVKFTQMLTMVREGAVHSGWWTVARRCWGAGTGDLPVCVSAGGRPHVYPGSAGTGAGGRPYSTAGSAGTGREGVLPFRLAHVHATPLNPSPPHPTTTQIPFFVSQLVDDHTPLLGVLARGLVDDHTPLLGVLARGVRECSLRPLVGRELDLDPFLDNIAGFWVVKGVRGVRECSALPATASGEGARPGSLPGQHVSQHGSDCYHVCSSGAGGRVPLVGRELDLDTFLDNMRELDLDQGVLSLRPLVGRELDLDPFLDNIMTPHSPLTPPHSIDSSPPHSPPLFSSTSPYHSRRVIAEHHICLQHQRPGFIGVICSQLSMQAVVEAAVKQCTDVSRRTFGFCPEFEVHGDVHSTFAYVPAHIEYMLFEILKDAIASPQDTFSCLPSPPLRT
ncbi:unnamed protein product [Closterium sp. Naga37s-1]|nr:unnamed protein product [Closterium sp. Naga37s-1]